MKLELLVSAVEKDPRSLAEAMKIASDAVIVNQCDHHGYTAWKENGREIRCFSMEERGVGLSRNTALLFAEEDIVLFSDEDIRFDEGYEKKVLEAFLKNPDADVITFEASRSDLQILDSLKENRFETEVGPGVYDIHSPRVPSVEEIVKALHAMLTKIDKDKLWVNPDCGLKTRGVPETDASLRNMVAAAKQIREEV